MLMTLQYTVHERLSAPTRAFWQDHEAQTSKREATVWVTGPLPLLRLDALGSNFRSDRQLQLLNRSTFANTFPRIGQAQGSHYAGSCIDHHRKIKSAGQNSKLDVKLQKKAVGTIIYPLGVQYSTAISAVIPARPFLPFPVSHLFISNYTALY
jgi:hypothetical protein